MGPGGQAPIPQMANARLAWPRRTPPLSEGFSDPSAGLRKSPSLDYAAPPHSEHSPSQGGGAPGGAQAMQSFAFRLPSLAQDAPTVVVEDLRLCTVKPCEDLERRFCFEVVSPTK